ncbi:phage tail protein [Shewanella xiamenensis]|uniref:phage tail-collar fiber domain-containing protein n=1 Tax=Shewanella xiamenensis TaxID=332186 RepID=UPI0035BB7543
MASVITIAGEQLFAAKAQANEQLDIDTFIFANVPNQDPSAPINREEGIPTAHIVYQQNVQQVGRVNDNVVVYSTVLDSITGPFEFNWVGLYSSVNQKLVAINHVPTVTKTVTAPGEAGNTLNRNFGIEYSGIAALTNITVDAETWQLNFTARLSGMDKLTQQLAADMNGKDWFIDDGLKVVPRATANSFSVTPGVGYVSGLRVELKQEHILIVQSYPQFVYVDAWFSGNANSTWSPQLAFTVTNTEMDDYIDPSGTQHYVYKLAKINSTNNVEDFRNNNGLKVRLDKIESPTGSKNIGDGEGYLYEFTDRIGRYKTVNDCVVNDDVFKTKDGRGEVIDHEIIKNPDISMYSINSSIKDEHLKAIGGDETGELGDVDHYIGLAIKKSGGYIGFSSFDGNGLGTFDPYRTDIVNKWINAFVFAENNQKIVGNTILRPCGHAIENTQLANRGLIAALNYAYKHNGLGVTGVLGYVSANNISDTTSDSHITENSCTNAALVGNIGHSAIAASGQDLAGGLNVVSASSVFANNQFAGIWALKSPNTGMVLTNANIHGHVLSGNTKYPGAENGQGELTLGDYNNPTEYQGKAWFAHGNLIDVSSGTNFSLGAWVHKYVSAPSVSFNYFTGVDKPSDAVQLVDEGAEYASYIGNIGRTASIAGEFVYSTLNIKTKVASRGASYANNDGMRVDLESPVRPEVMHDEDANWVYTCVLKPNSNDEGLVKLFYDGGFTTYTIKLTVTSHNGGMLEKLIVLKGAHNIATTVLANVDVHAFGEVIGISINTTDTDYTDIILQPHDGYYGIKLEIISPTSDRNHIRMFY